MLFRYEQLGVNRAAIEWQPDRFDTDTDPDADSGN